MKKQPFDQQYKDLFYAALHSWNLHHGKFELYTPPEPLGGKFPVHYISLWANDRRLIAIDYNFFTVTVTFYGFRHISVREKNYKKAHKLTLPFFEALKVRKVIKSRIKEHDLVQREEVEKKGIRDKMSFLTKGDQP